jgi:hypothetical protein
MSDASMSALAVSLRLNRSLATLDLTDCRVSLSGWQSFRSAMRQNQTLQNLRLASGASPFEALDAFRRAVPSTYTGRRLQLKEAEVFALYEDIRASARVAIGTSPRTSRSPRSRTSARSTTCSIRRCCRRRASSSSPTCRHISSTRPTRRSLNRRFASFNCTRTK